MSELFAFQVAKEVPVLSRPAHFDASKQQWVADGTAMAAEALATFRPAATGCVLVGTPFLDGPIDLPTDVINLG